MCRVSLDQTGWDASAPFGDPDFLRVLADVRLPGECAGPQFRDRKIQNPVGKNRVGIAGDGMQNRYGICFAAQDEFPVAWTGKYACHVKALIYR